MTLLKRSTLFCLFIPNFFVIAQSSHSEPSFSISVTGAVPFSSPGIHDFLEIGISEKIPPGIFGSVGIGCGPFTLSWLDPTKFSFSAEISYCDLRTAIPSTSNRHSQSIFTKTSEIGWMILFIPAHISPFVRAGIGISQLTFEENYEAPVYEDVSWKGTSVILGIGGVKFSLTDYFTLSAFGDALFTPGSFSVTHKDGTPWVTYYFGATPMLGIRSEIRL